MTTENKLGTIGRSQLVRPRFSAGQMLQDDDLTEAVDHARAMNRLMFRSLLGCGVVCGLEVTLHAAAGCAEIHIAPGLALNGSGDAIEVAEAQVIRLRGPVTDPLWVVIAHREFACSPRELECSNNEDSADTALSRLVDGFEISLVESKTAPDDTCGCPDLVHAATADKAEEARIEFYKNRSSGQCDCDCISNLVLLGVFEKTTEVCTEARNGPDQRANHNVRRFIGPVLMRDPLFTFALPGTTAKPDVPKKAPTPTAAQELALQKLKAAKENQNTALADAKRIRDELGNANPTDQDNINRLVSELVDAGRKVEITVEEVSAATAAVLLPETTIAAA